MILQQQPSTFRGRIGVARRDITPPVGIYNRLWGAAKHDTAIGVHRPLRATVLWLQNHARRVALISYDGSWFPGRELRTAILDDLRAATGLSSSDVMLSSTHTHAACSLNLDLADRAGGHLIKPYIELVRTRLIEALLEAEQMARPATLTFATGSCDLASNRDLPEPGGKRFVVGFNPNRSADDTLLVGRVTDDVTGNVTATLVNYACHPTTLAFENRLISPDYVGAMREIVEQHTSGAPCLFFQGASGEMAPRQQYVGDPGVPDRHGRQLGFAVLSTLTGMLPAGQRLAYQGVVESGASLAIWKPEPFEPSSELDVLEIQVPLPLRDLPTAAQLKADLANCTDRVIAERLRRKLQLIEFVGPGPTCDMPAWVWRVGDALIVGQPNEAYSEFQIQLRERFRGRAVMVMNLVNGACGYLSPPENYDVEIYPVLQTPFGREGLATLKKHVVSAMEKLVAAE